jgi:hypothetical protein
MRSRITGAAVGGLVLALAGCGHGSIEPLGPSTTTFELIDPVPRLRHTHAGDSLYVVAERIEFQPGGRFGATRVLRTLRRGGGSSDTAHLMRGRYARSGDTLTLRIADRPRADRYTLARDGRTLLGPPLGASHVGNGSLIVHTFRRLD